MGPRLVNIARAGAREVVPIVAATHPMRDIPLATLRRIFLSKPVQDSAGRRFVPFNHPPHTWARVLFDRRVLDMSPEEVARYWVDQRIRGNPGPPRTVASVKLLKRVVRRFPGAISYLPPSELDDSVKALSVGGVHHTHEDYPIR